MTILENLIRDEQGATAIEYGLIAMLVAVAAITAMENLGTEMSTMYNGVQTKMIAANSANA